MSQKSGSHHSDQLFLMGGGEMGELIRSVDWASTSLGPPETWPAALKIIVATALSSKFPMLICWGQDYTQLYNDEFRPILGATKHPQAMGISASETYAEIWETIQPMFAGVMGGQAVGFSDFMVQMDRNGYLEDCYFDFSYSPIRDERGNIGGILVVCTETTDKVLAIQNLKESEQRFRLMAEGSDVFIAVGDETSNAIYFNQAWANLTGKSAEELLEFGWADLVHPDDKEWYVDLYLSAFEQKIPYSGEFRVRNKNGDYCWLLSKNLPRFNPDGSFAGYVSSCIDITERKAMEERLFESQHMVRSMVDSTPFPIGVYVGREMRIELANQAIIDVWGKGNDVIGKLYSEILPELNNQEIFSQVDEVFTTGIPFHARNQRVDIVVDGRLQSFYFNYSFTPLFDRSGNIYAVMNTAADVTDLNIAKQQVEQSGRNFRNMILQAPVAMCILLGPDHVIEVANQLMIQLWGKAEADVMGKPVFVALPDAREQGLEQLLADVYHTGIAFQANEMPVSLLRNGQLDVVYQNFVYESYRDADGTILGVIATTTDVTEQVLARQKVEKSETELLEIKERLELELEAGKQLQQQKDDFIGIASHELKTPLTALKGSMQLLSRWAKEDSHSAKIQHLIDLSASNIIKLNHLLEELLNDTKISEGQLQLNKSHFVMADVINECCGHIRAMGEYSIVIKGDVTVKVWADKHRIDQVLVNLINNATKYAPLSKEILVVIEHADPDVKVSVTDKGPGILSEKLPHLFKRYYRVDTSGVQYSGLGLGLFISSEIIRRHGGEIGVESSTGKGSTFWFTIPGSSDSR